MSPLRPIKCTDPNGHVRVFYYDVDDDPGGEDVFVRVHATRQPNSTDHWFDITLKKSAPDTLIVSMQMKNKNALYGAKGILDAMIPGLAATLNKRIVSSSNTQNQYLNEYRNTAGEKVWRRLEADGRAKYNTITDRYELL